MARSKCFFDDVKKELECSVCQEQFSEIKEPKILKCLHTFCKTCLEAWLRQQREGELSCPTCRHITECPHNDINRLPSNLFCKQLVEIVEAYSGQGQEDSPQCGNCEEKKSLKVYCFDCNCFLCEDCAEAHKKWKTFRGHHIKEIGKFNSSDVQDYARKTNVCKNDEDELRYYCDKCKMCICRDCAILEHRDHNIISFEQGLDRKKSDMTNKMKEVEAVGCLLRNEKETLEKRGLRVDNSIDQATTEVHRFAEHCISLIRKHEATMTEELVKQKANSKAEFSSQMTKLNEKLMDIDNSLEFGRDVLERNNLPEILNVEETLERRFQDFLSSAEISRSTEMNTSGVKYVPSDVSNIENGLGKVFVTNTEPSLSIARGKGLTEGCQGEYCTFTIVTKDLRDQTTYSEIDHVNVEIHSPVTGRVVKPNITDSKDGCYEVNYKPEDAGEFNLSITVRDEAVLGSPFLLKVKERLPKLRESSVISGLPLMQKCSSRNTRQGQRNNSTDSEVQQTGFHLPQHLNQVLKNGVVLSLYQGDITDERVDAIVNAANENLQHGAGVAAAIVRKGGRQIQDESNRLIKKYGQLDVGEATYTGGGILPCCYVIHAVGPRWGAHGSEKSIFLLRQACARSLRLAAQLELSSIALTAISSGIFGMPKDICAQVMFKAVEAFSASDGAEFSTLRDVRMVIIDDPTISVFQEEFVKRYLSKEAPRTVTNQRLPSHEDRETSPPTILKQDPQKFSGDNSVNSMGRTQNEDNKPSDAKSEPDGELESPREQTAQGEENNDQRDVSDSVKERPLSNQGTGQYEQSQYTLQC